MYSEEAKEYAKEQEAKLQPLMERIHGPDSHRSTGREDSERDYARVLYSSSFRRLQGKMQLLGVETGKFNRNRLTHSLEVAQIARSIADGLELKTRVFAETASLAHDIGNPPFGHSGENVLNDLSKEVGGYEGNAQAFRILRTLERKTHNYPGLNLTLRTMMGVTKYFYKRKDNPKKFLYDDDYDFLKNKLEQHDVFVTKSIDAQIMDLADEIAYAAHDLEDALSFGLISLGEMVHEFNISEKFGPAYDDMKGLAQSAQSEAMKATELATSEEYAIVLKKEITSSIVNKLVNDIGLVDGVNRPDFPRHLKSLTMRVP
ncbi:dNTP triphosphohydrolase, partial [Guyparkeria sp. SCN-R1]|uniref:dGTP triphosphohydrolase n=1 Tax=Guyparkeria sp. SCN-R1 TaxID=2341113 RepID=UPI000F64855B